LASDSAALPGVGDFGGDFCGAANVGQRDVAGDADDPAGARLDGSERLVIVVVDIGQPV